MTRKRPTSPTITPNGQKKAKLHRNSSPQTSSTSHTNDNALSGRLYVVLDGNKDDKHYMRRIRREKKEECQKQGRILLPRHIISSDGILTFFWRKKPPLAPLFQSIANAEVVARPDDCGLKVDDPIIIDIDQGSSSSKPASTANRATSVKTRDSSLAYVLMNENTHMSALTSTHLDPCHDRDSAAILERQASHEGSSRSLTPQRRRWMRFL
ncbi:hypothetical protein PLICRDRAFT_121054 [Plicaturopsis crispa FD-325 SS-3]|nr:hypothetical protein PLICRDRAFT_121054 [Plicaturopsis crispa FD-325 SS-3]